MEQITEKHIVKAHESVEKAREMDTPFLARGRDEELMVVGDPNKTEVVKTSYIISFRFNKQELGEIPEGSKVIGDYVVCRIEYKDIVLNGKNDLTLVRSLQKMVSIFNGLDELKDWREEQFEELNAKGYDQEKYNEEIKKIDAEFGDKFIDIYAYASSEAQDSLYDFVALLLGLDDFMKDHMMAMSVVATFCEFILRNPNLWNETEALFGY